MTPEESVREAFDDLIKVLARKGFTFPQCEMAGETW
jgi:virulence-associated protein VapD